MRKPKILMVFVLFFVPLTSTLPTFGGDQPYAVLPDGSKVDLSATCPVCGMKVGGDLEGTATYSYRDDRLIGFAGVAAAVFKDGRVVGFEGARCLFIYNTIPRRFGINVDDIVRRYVTDFTTWKMIDVKGASLVLGSTVMGPMGYELVPFSKREEAEKFKTDYSGKRLVDFSSVGASDVERRQKERRSPR
jgi:nitrous oxide reductase accessory protein NosL